MRLEVLLDFALALVPHWPSVLTILIIGIHAFHSIRTLHKYVHAIISYVEGALTSNYAIERMQSSQEWRTSNPNEIAVVIGMNQKTVQMAPTDLVSTKHDVKWKKLSHY